MMNKYYILIVTIVGLMLAGCTKEEGEKRAGYNLHGAWIMKRIVYSVNNVAEDFPFQGTTYCRIYEGDSVCYECRISALKPEQPEDIMTASDVFIIPAGKYSCTLIQKDGQGNPLYLEDGSVRPILFPSDTSMVIQRHGNRFTWVLAQDMEPARMEEIKRIIANNLNNGDMAHRFVLPTTERQLKTTNHTLTYVIIILMLVVLFIVHVTITFYRKKRRIEQQLRQINEEREQRPQPVRQAMAEVEAEFLNSDSYRQLRWRITVGEVWQKPDWDEVEQLLRPVWPGFTNRLLGLCHMSELEYRVCLLIKLRVPPSEMAALLSKEASTISSVRSRLYQKVFQRKGSCKDWDQFILSI